MNNVDEKLSHNFIYLNRSGQYFPRAAHESYNYYMQSNIDMILDDIFVAKIIKEYRLINFEERVNICIDAIGDWYRLYKSPTFSQNVSTVLNNMKIDFNIDHDELKIDTKKIIELYKMHEFDAGLDGAKVFVDDLNKNLRFVYLFNREIKEITVSYEFKLADKIEMDFPDLADEYKTLGYEIKLPDKIEMDLADVTAEYKKLGEEGVIQPDLEG